MNRIQHSKSTTTISVEVVIFKEDDNYVAFCPALNLSAYDSTIQGAKDAFEINMKIFMDETRRKGTFERYLLKLGWTLRQQPTIEYSQPPINSISFGSMVNKKIEKVINSKMSFQTC
ncbi:MAG TPA: hypothetical protein PLH91_03655 [Tenuifilaceae bacterium]|nr:hypothetical protein [Tenuifilaceae bacterium]HPI44303.1 hypothetical protein [Tenuifilaceae bacterium]HPN23117.1 hypothetical protein [Tenuifilaceae bacterium]